MQHRKAIKTPGRRPTKLAQAGIFIYIRIKKAVPAATPRGARYKAAMTQKELADKLGLRQHHLSEMEHGKRPIGKQMAKRLGEVLRCDYRLFV